MALTHLIVGAGNMGGSLLSGWLSSGLISPKNLCVIDPSPGTDAVYAIERGARHLAGPSDIPSSVDTVMLGIKPQMFGRLGPELAAHLQDGALVISIMAGISLGRLSDTFASSHVVRAMPNTPASVGKGITAYVADAGTDPAIIERADALLASTGKAIRVETDEQINAVTAISGSGPAYVFNMVEAMTAAGLALGLSPDTAAQLARQTMIGASALLDATERTPTDLREAVTSPGGTTQAALEILMADDGLHPLMRRATRAAMDRSRELSGD